MTEIDRFTAELDHLLAGRPVDPTGLTYEDQRALELVQKIVQEDFHSSLLGKQRLRQRLEHRAASTHHSSDTLLERSWAPWLGLAVLILLFLNGAFTSLSPVGASTAGALATAYAAPARTDLSSASLAAHTQVALPHESSQFKPLEFPQPVPTPLAPPGTSPPALQPSADTPGVGSPLATP